MPAAPVARCQGRRRHADAVGTNTYTGATTVNAGDAVRQRIDRVVERRDRQRRRHARRQRHVPATTTINGGTLAPGNSIGTLTITGQSGAPAGARPTWSRSRRRNADRTNVTGTATLAGTVQAVFAPGSYIARTYTILSAAGGRSGTFGSLTTTTCRPASRRASATPATDAILNLTAALGSRAQRAGPQAEPAERRQRAQQFLQQRRHAAAQLRRRLRADRRQSRQRALAALRRGRDRRASRPASRWRASSSTLMLDPFVDGRSGIAGTGGPALGFAPERDATLPADIALAYSSVLKAPADEAPSIRAALDRVGRRLWRHNQHQRRSGGARQPRSHRAHRGFAGGLDYRFSPDTRRRLRARRRRHQLEPRQRSRRRQERCLPGRRLRRQRSGPGLSRGGARLHQSLDVDRPLRLRRRPSHRQLQRAELRRARRERLSLRDAWSAG